MRRRTIPAVMILAACCLAVRGDGAEPGDAAAAIAPAWTVDHRYAPSWWQTSICLPDDWQKTLVGKEGQLLYDFRGKYSGFKTRIAFDLGEAGDASTEWVGQELIGPRVPIVRTLKRSGAVEIVEEALAVAPPLRPGQEGTVVERLDEGRDLVKWAAPKGECDPAFRNIAVGFAQSIRYRFRVFDPGPYTVVFGLCEGHWKEPAKRPLDLVIEGKTRKTVDMVGEHGRNVPVLFPFQARDEDGDGWIDVTVAAAKGAADRNTILNVLWIFDGEAPPTEELLAGQSPRRALAHLDCGQPLPETRPPRHDVILVRLRNRGEKGGTVRPSVLVESELKITPRAEPARVDVGPETVLSASRPFEASVEGPNKVRLRFEPVKLAAGAEGQLAIGVGRGQRPRLVPRDWETAVAFRRRAEQYWKQADLPYGRIAVPDAGVQAQLDSAIRNIYQAREIKDGLPAFQVGPTCYRGLWVVDGSFLLEAVAFLGRVDEARAGIDYLLGFQRDDGAVMIIDGHLKETGIALWAVTRHARLTGDPTWLFKVWPNVERGFDSIRSMRAATWSNPEAPNYKLVPEGFSDGGLPGKYPEYTNVYWTLVGLRAAVDAAEWLGNTVQAAEWRREYDDFYATFRRAAERDMVTDARGNRCLPIRMRDDQDVPVQKAQWAFLHAVFPGKLFPADDPPVEGNMAMLRAVEREGLVYDTGWVAGGIWNYFGSFYAHAWLWRGEGRKAAETLYAFANHASPLLAWREEQRPLGEGDQVCGDMPHNWASAEFIRLVRHLLVLERGRELHLFEGLPPTWARPGAVTRVENVLTEFGPVTFELRVADDGSQATLNLDPPTRNPAGKIVVHLAGWSGREGTIELPGEGAVKRSIPLGDD